MELLLGKAPRQADHFKRRGHLRRAAAEHERNLVAQGQLRLQRLQVPQLRRDVQRLDRRSHQMNDVKVLGQPHEILVVRERSRPPTTNAVADIGRPRNRHDCHVAPADRDVTRRVGGPRVDGGRRRGQRACDQTPVEPHHVAAGLHACTRGGKVIARLRQQHTDTGALEYIQRALMDIRNLVVAEHPQRLERIHQLAVGCRSRHHGCIGADTPAPVEPGIAANFTVGHGSSCWRLAVPTRPWHEQLPPGRAPVTGRDHTMRNAERVLGGDLRSGLSAARTGSLSLAPMRESRSALAAMAVQRRMGRRRPAVRRRL